MNATPEPTPAGAVTLGRVALSEKHVAALAAPLPFGLFVLGAVALAVMVANRKKPASDVANTPPAPPAVPPVTAPGPVTEPPPAPAPSPDPAIPLA